MSNTTPTRKVLAAVANNELPIEALVGLFINRSTGTDTRPLGQVVGTKGKRTLLLRVVEATLVNRDALNFHVGGFCANCSNQDEQKYTYQVTEQVVEFKVYKNDHYAWSSSVPVMYYDYNF